MENNNIQTENMEFDPVCPNCGKESRGTSLFCTKCGAKLNVKEKEWICTACGKDNVAENKKFCGYCGAPKIEKDTTSSITTNSIDNIPTPSSDTSFTSPMPPTGQTDFAVPDIPEITENNPVKAKPKRNKKYAIIIAGISIVVILLTVLIPTALVPFLTEDKDDNIDIAEAYKNGETIVFGEYQWRILDLQSDKALIITENIVREQSFMQNINGEITWEGSAIRDYLNGSFYQSFTSEEQDKILAVQNHTECEPDTTDHIFLLSIDEADLYFENDSERAIGRIWWLRTPAVYDGLGSLSDEDPPIMGHATVTASGAIEDEGGFYMDSTGMLVDGNLASYGVRPALWLKLVESDGSPDVAPGNSQNSSDSSLTASVSVQGKWYQPSSDLEEKYYPEVTFNADNTFHFVVNLYHTMSYVDGTYVINGETVNCQVTSRGFPANSTWGTVESFRFVISTNGLTYDGEQIGTTYQNSIFQRDNRPSAPSTALTSRPEDTSTLVNQTSPTTTSKTPQPTTSITHAPQTTTSEEKPITIGQAIEFGNPRWDGSRRWYVLDIKDGKALVFPDSGFTGTPSLVYHEYDEAVTWETCSLREYLNNDYFNANFTIPERERIVTTTIINDDNPDWGTEGGNNTQDKFFLLSIDEVKRYSEQLSTFMNPRWYSSNMLLRSPGKDETYAAVYRINEDGTSPPAVDTVGIEVHIGFNVYPACWITLN